MTFKHVKFEDSPTMRALEKVAKEKGLVKPEPISKTASPVVDLTPTSDLMSNIFKLCTGLRSQGFHKYANELEVNFLNYKRAQTLYETSKEKGEDLVGAAHPKGSHKLENVEGDEATIEDILDQHAKILQVVEKKPHGKLSTAAEAIMAVKRVLGQEASGLTKEQIEEYVLKYIVDRCWAVRNEQAYAAFKEAEPSLKGKESSEVRLFGLIDSDYIDLQKAMNGVDNVIKSMSPNVPTERLLGDLKRAYDVCISESQEIPNDLVKSRVIAKFNTAKNATDQLINQLKSLSVNPSVLPEGVPSPAASVPTTIKEVTNVADPVLGKGVELIGKLKTYKTYANVARNRGASSWVDSEIKEVQDVMKRFNDAALARGPDTEVDDQTRANFQTEMGTLEKEINDFYARITGTKK